MDRDNKGRFLPGSGGGAAKKGKTHKTTAFKKAIEALSDVAKPDDVKELAVQTLAAGMKDNDPKIAIHCAEVLMKYCFPAKKEVDLGDGAKRMLRIYREKKDIVVKD